jgi:hypothetical protein
MVPVMPATCGVPGTSFMTVGVPSPALLPADVGAAGLLVPQLASNMEVMAASATTFHLDLDIRIYVSFRQWLRNPAGHDACNALMGYASMQPG